MSVFSNMFTIIQEISASKRMQIRRSIEDSHIFLALVIQSGIINTNSCYLIQSYFDTITQYSGRKTKQNQEARTKHEKSQ